MGIYAARLKHTCIYKFGYSKKPRLRASSQQVAGVSVPMKIIHVSYDARRGHERRLLKWAAVNCEARCYDMGKEWFRFIAIKDELVQKATKAAAKCVLNRIQLDVENGSRK